MLFTSHAQLFLYRETANSMVFSWTLSRKFQITAVDTDKRISPCLQLMATQFHRLRQYIGEEHSNWTYIYATKLEKTESGIPKWWPTPTKRVYLSSQTR